MRRSPSSPRSRSAAVVPRAPLATGGRGPRSASAMVSCPPAARQSGCASREVAHSAGWIYALLRSMLQAHEEAFKQEAKGSNAPER